MGKRLRAVDLSPESAKRFRAAGVKRQQDYRDRLADIGLTATARLRDVSNQPLISSYLAPGSSFKPRAVQQSLHRYFTTG
jgi:hypothetical protein